MPFNVFLSHKGLGAVRTFVGAGLVGVFRAHLNVQLQDSLGLECLGAMGALVGAFLRVDYCMDFWPPDHLSTDITLCSALLLVHISDVEP